MHRSPYTPFPTDLQQWLSQRQAWTQKGAYTLPQQIHCCKLTTYQKLQRAIAESRGQSSGRPLPIALEHAGSVDGSYRSDDSATETKVRQGEALAPGVTPSAKRKYRRHPKVSLVPTRRRVSFLSQFGHILTSISAGRACAGTTSICLCDILESCASPQRPGANLLIHSQK